MPYLVKFSYIQKGQIRQKDHPVGLKSATSTTTTQHSGGEKKVKSMGENSSSEAYNTGKNHNNIDTLSIGTEVPNFP